jgi:hypothetical protein
MLRKLLFLIAAGVWLAACAAPDGVPLDAGTATQAPATDLPATNPLAETATPIATGTPTPSAVDETAEPPAIIEPPPATLTIDGQTQVSGIGTFCWNNGEAGAGLGVCVDKLGVPTPREPIVVDAAPFTAQLTFPLEQPPSSVSLMLIPVSAEDEMTVGGTPDWRWWPFAGGQSMELTPGVTTEVELAPEPGLYALTAFTFFEGRGDVVYGFLVRVGGVGGETGGGVAFVLPASCQPHDNLSPYLDPGGRYCLLFPSYFRIGDVTLDRANFYGPPLDPSLEPVMASLGVSVVGPAGGRSLTEVVEAYVAENALGQAVTRSEIVLSNEPAIVVEGLPGRTGHWQAFAVHGDTVYQLSLAPKDEQFPQAAGDVEAVWGAVSTSLTFLN